MPLVRSTCLGWVLAGLLVAAPAWSFLWPGQIDRVEQGLRDDDVAARRQAAGRLHELPATAARRLVPVALADPDPEVRLAAVPATRRGASRDSVPLLLPWLTEADRRLRLAAAEVLGTIPDERAVGPLGRTLADPDAEVREAAAVALGMTGRSEAARALLGRLDDAVPRVREAVVDALARLGDPSAVTPLLGKVQDPTLTVRRRVVRALGALGDERAASSLLLALQDPDERVRVEALAALGRLGVDAAVPGIVALLVHEEGSVVRQSAVAALGAIGTDAAVSALIQLFPEPGTGVDTGDLAAALGRVGSGALPRLERCLAGQPEAALARGCAVALGEVGGPDAATALTLALRRGIVEVPVALAAMGRAGEESALPAVLEHLADREPGSRAAAAAAAARLLEPRRPDGRAVAPLTQALRAAREGEERARLLELLGRTGSPTAVSALLPHVASNDEPSSRRVAIAALGSIAPAGQDHVLLEALEDRDAETRWAAAVALWRCASGAAARVLLDRFETAAERDRVALLVALGGAVSRSSEPQLLERVAGLAQRSRGGERDALIEALGRAQGRHAARLLAILGAPRAPLPDRAKVAEMLATHPEGLTRLRQLASEREGAVRANAIWSLGAVGTEEDATRLVAALRDPDLQVAGNAAGALGRLARRTRTAARGPLCDAIEAPRAWVRTNALIALALLEERCEPALTRRLLLGDPSPMVRRAAAQVLLRLPAQDPRPDRAALDRCAQQERDGRVAALCAEGKSASREPSSATEPALVYVVPAGETAPRPRAPFALALPDGLTRLGFADRRGAVFEAQSPPGILALEIPAPLDG